MSQIVIGPFSARNFGAGSWALTQAEVCGSAVYLRGARPDASLPPDAVAQVVVAWRAKDVEVALTTSQGIRVLQADSVIIHEPNPRLYESLPLPGFDAAARTFWKRVFLLIRIPGGRFLLGLIARRERGGRRATKK
jgi:hypothetical protein